MWIVETRFIEIDERGRDAQACAASAVAEADVRFPCFPLGAGIADVGERAAAGDAAALEGAEVLGRLKDFPARQRHEDRQRASGDLVGCRRRGRFYGRGVAGAVVALAEESLLAADQTVGVTDGGPEDGGGCHRAARDGIDLALMAAAAGFLGDAKVAWIDELHELRRLFQKSRVAALRIGRGLPDLGMERLYVRGFFRARRTVAAVAIGAGKLHRGRGMHRLDSVMTREASGTLRVGLGLRLAHQWREVG